MRLAFTFNVRHMAQSMEKDAQDQAEFDEPATVKAIHNAIVANGHTCVDVEADENAFDKFRKLKGKIDLVFNIAEGLRGEMREAQIPAMLEMLGIPYTHSGALTNAITLDKTLTKKIWLFHGVPTPKFALIGPNDKPYVEGLKFPVIVKPNSEGSSKGVFNDCFIENPDKLVAKIRKTTKDYGNGVLIEEFVGGREFTVTVMGNPGVGKGVYILPIVEQNFDIFPKNLRKFSSFEAKWFFEDKLPNPFDAITCPAKVDSKLGKRIEDVCIQAYTVLHCRDIARIDLRLDTQGNPSLLEINTLPGMIPGTDAVSYFPVAARAVGWDFTKMVGMVVAHAKERLGL